MATAVENNGTTGQPGIDQANPHKERRPYDYGLPFPFPLRRNRCTNTSQAATLWHITARMKTSTLDCLRSVETSNLVFTRQYSLDEMRRIWNSCLTSSQPAKSQIRQPSTTWSFRFRVDHLCAIPDQCRHA